jgi:hypothetical protein
VAAAVVQWTPVMQWAAMELQGDCSGAAAFGILGTVVGERDCTLVLGSCSPGRCAGCGTLCMVLFFLCL